MGLRKVVEKEIDYSKPYVIVSSYNLERLVQSVNIYILHGYAPLGAPQFVMEETTHYYMQGMVKGRIVYDAPS